VVEGPEFCDGDCVTNCDDDNQCTIDELYGDPYYCFSACFRIPVGCADGDGCCSDFGSLLGICTNLNDSDCPPPPGDVGSPCANDEQCTDVDVDDPDANADGVSCLPAQAEDGFAFSASFAGGYCTRTDCALAGCPEGGTCVCPNGGGEGSSCAPGGSQAVAFDVGFGFFGTCLETCETSEDCRSQGYDCYDVNGDGTKECYLYGTGDREFGESCDGIWQCDGGEITRCAALLNLSTNEDLGRICSRLCSPNEGEFPDCPEDFRCYGNTCQPTPPAENLGGPCTRNSDCGEAGVNGNRCLTAIGGYENGFCTTGYSEDDCPEGSRYVSINGGQPGSSGPGFSGCAPLCDNDSDCRSDESYACITPDDEGESVCAARWDGDGEIGDSCEGNWDCNSEDGYLCAGGTCNRYCGFEDFSCPSGYGCFINTCRPTCQSNADCPGDTGICGSFITTESGEKLCL
jgi:hypothetical protein